MTDRQDSERTIAALATIAPHPANFRKTLGDLDELGESIIAQGRVIEPLEVMPADRVAVAWPEHAEALSGHAWVLLWGHRRLAAARQVFGAGPDACVPVVIRRDAICDDARRQVDEMVTEEVAHRPWNPIEQARAFHQAATAGRSQRQIAKLCGCTHAHVSRRLSLLRLPEEIQEAVETGRLRVQDAWKLARLADQDAMRAAWGLYLDRREDAWIATIDQAIAEHADRVDYRARRQAAFSVAEAEGLRVIDPVEEFGQDLPVRRLTGPEPVAAARAAGTLVTGVSGDGTLEYYTTDPGTTRAPRPAAPDPDQRRAAAAARERAGRLLAATRPPAVPAALAPMVDAFLRSAPDGWRPIAQRWLRWLQLGPAADVEPARWWEQIYAAEWEARVWAAHCLALAGSEHRARTRPEWDDADRVWLWRLVSDAGYLPRPWERHRLRAEPHGGPGAERAADRLPPEDPPDWFDRYEQCHAHVWLTGIGIARLERDPRRFHEVAQCQQCNLEQEHPGPHAAHVQDAHAEHYDPGQPHPTGALALWARWRDNPDDHRVTPADTCPATHHDPGPPPDEHACLLFAGHPGRHH